ncbi:hypothetical protein F5884DRAFT_62436 [Xylogone sp. PMI_703]|nr:hypothetical protein F5884DRAFT_62436 [Xylogone sp. PMI_703]
MFAPLSPTSSRSLAKIHEDHGRPPPEKTEPSPPSSRESSPERPHRHHHHHHHRRRRRRNSEPPSNRPTVRRSRRHRRDSSSSPSPTRRDREEESSSDVEVLPDRFDEDGRPLDSPTYGRRSRSTGPARGSDDMVQKIARSFTDVMDGKASWKDLLKTFLEDLPNDSSGGSRRKRR